MHAVDDCFSGIFRKVDSALILHYSIRHQVLIIIPFISGESSIDLIE